MNEEEEPGLFIVTAAKICKRFLAVYDVNVQTFFSRYRHMSKRRKLQSEMITALVCDSNKQSRADEA